MCASEEAWAAALAACTEAFGQPNVLINNAGIGSSGKPVHEETVETMRANFDVNVHRHVPRHEDRHPRHDRARRRRRSSTSPRSGAGPGIKNNVAYQTAKAAAVMLSKNAAVTYAPHEHPHQLRAARLRRHADVAHA